MSLLQNFDINRNFWIQYPAYKIPRIYKGIYDKDKSKAKQDTSRIMWSIVLLYDTSSNNSISKYPESEKKIIIEADYFEGKLNWDKYKYVMKFFKDSQLSPDERELIELNNKLDERWKFLKDTKYSIDNAKDLDTIMANTEKLYTLRDKLTEAIRKEKEKGGTTKGGLEESISELKLI
jgi:hypothetical protein